MLFPERCACGRVGVLPCRSCAAELVEASPFSVAGLDFCWAPFAYQGTAGELIRALKFGRNRAVVAWAAKVMTTGAARHTWVGPNAQRGSARRGQPAPLVVTWIPASEDGRRDRGFDQGELLARSIARRLGVPSRALLVRSPSRFSRQTRADREHRLTGPGLRLRSPVSNRLVDLMVLVVDDVITTGGSMTEAAQLLRHAGAPSIAGLALARADRAQLSPAVANPPRTSPGRVDVLGIPSKNGSQNQSSTDRIVTSS